MFVVASAMTDRNISNVFGVFCFVVRFVFVTPTADCRAIFFLFLRKSIAFTQVRVTFHPKRNAAISQTELFTWQRQIKNTDTVIQSSCSMEHWSKQLAVVTSSKKKKETKVYEWAIKPLIYVYNGENIVWICTGDRSFSRRIGCKVRYHYTASRVFH